MLKIYNQSECLNTCHPQTTDKKVLQLLVCNLVCNFLSWIEKSIHASFTDKEVI